MPSPVKMMAISDQVEEDFMSISPMKSKSGSLKGSVSSLFYGNSLLSSLALTVVFLILGSATQPLSAADIVVKEVGGAPVMRCKIRHGREFIDTHVIFDISLQSPLVIHSMSVRGLGIQPMMARGKTVDVEFGGNTRLKGVPIGITEDKLLHKMTMLYADTLGQIPVTAIIGLGAFKENVVELDMQRGLLRSLRMASAETRAMEMDCQVSSSGVVVNGVGPEQTPVKALISTRQMDSYMAQSLLEKARKSGKRGLELKVGNIDFGKLTAFRFPPIGSSDHPKDTDVILGLGAVRNHAVTIWPKRNKIAFIQRNKGHYPRSEQEYFYALVDKDPVGVRKFVDKNKGHRLMDEALIRLWKMRSSDPASTTQELKTILELIAAKYDRLRRASALSQVSDSIESSERTDKDELSMHALELAMAQTGKALNHSAVHFVHLRLGKKAYEKGDLKTARRHLLSAAFGLPKNAECNFWLAEVYRKMGKPRRAWSRYYQAIVDVDGTDEIKAESLKRIELLNNDPEFRKTFTMTMAEQYTSGRSTAGEFHAEYRYKLEKHKFPGRVRLVESFVDSTKPYTNIQQTAFSGLSEYFEGDIALIEYHLDDKLHSDVAVARRKYYSPGPKPVMVFDGIPTDVPYSPPKHDNLEIKARVYYESLKAKCLLKTPLVDSGWTLNARMTRDGRDVSGTVSIAGEGEADNVHLHAIVCERSVMAVQANGIMFHRFVARSSLTPANGIAVQTLVKTPLEFSVNADSIAKQLGRPENYVDSQLLIVVAFLQRQSDGRVIVAGSFSLPQEDEMF